MLTMQIRWPITIWPVENGSGQKSSFSTSWTRPLSIVTSFLSSCGGKKISHRDFRLTLIRAMLARAGHETWPSMPVGKPALASTNIGRLDTCHNKHWPGYNPTKWQCHVCTVRAVMQMVMFKCVKCDVTLCVDWNYFCRLPHKVQLMRHHLVRPLYKQMKSRPQCK